MLQSIIIFNALQIYFHIFFVIIIFNTLQIYFHIFFVFYLPLDISYQKNPDDFLEYLFFFPRSSLLNISRRLFFAYRTDNIFLRGNNIILGCVTHALNCRILTIFPGDPNCSSNTCYIFKRKIFLFVEYILIFQEASFFYSNRYQFSSKSYLVIEHIRLSRRLYAIEQTHIPGRFPQNRSRLLLSTY